MAFQTKISKARFVLGPFSAEQMQRIGQAGLDSIAARIHRGENCDDSAAKPLKPGRVTSRGNQAPGYPDYKMRRGLQPIRDWMWTGRTMRSLKVKRADENRATIGFIDLQSDTIAHINNRREKQFGVSPKDRAAVNAAVLNELRRQCPVRFENVA